MDKLFELVLSGYHEVRDPFEVENELKEDFRLDSARPYLLGVLYLKICSSCQEEELKVPVLSVASPVDRPPG